MAWASVLAIPTWVVIDLLMPGPLAFLTDDGLRGWLKRVGQWAVGGLGMLGVVLPLLHHPGVSQLGTRLPRRRELLAQLLAGVTGTSLALLAGLGRGSPLTLILFAMLWVIVSVGLVEGLLYPPWLDD